MFSNVLDVQFFPKQLREKKEKEKFRHVTQRLIKSKNNTSVM